MLEKENFLILTKYKIKERIQLILIKRQIKTLSLYKKFMENNLKTLKRINTTTTRAKIEMIINNATSTPAFDWQEEIVALNNIFALIIGIMDARNDEYKREIEFQRNFNNNEEVKNLELKQEKINKYKKEIISDYELFFERKDMLILKETISHNPLHEKIEDLFNDMKENSYGLVIQGQLINAYMIGYNNSLYIYPEEIIPYYNQIINEYKSDKAKNEYDYQKVKKLIKNEKHH